MAELDLSDKTNLIEGAVGDVVTAFLSNPPADVPSEVIEALSLHMASNDASLPPRLFYEVVEHLAVAISITDTKANILYANPAFEQLTSYHSMELVGKNQSILSHKKTPKAMYEQLWAALSAGKKWSGTLLNERKDGAPYLADLTVAPVFSEDGQVTHYLGIHRDVTEMTLLQTRVHNQKNMIETVIDMAPVVIAMLDENGKVMVENSAYKVLMTDMGGREPVDEFFTVLTDVLGENFKGLRKKRRNFDSVEIRVDVGGAKGTRWFSCSGTWVDNEEITADAYFDKKRRSGLLLVCTENTKQMRHFEEAKTNAIKALMAEQQASEGISEIVSAAIFQLQGPINMISAAVELLDRGAGDPENLKSLLKQVQHSGQEALERLQDSMPDSAREPRMPVNINELVREIMDITFDRLLRENVVVSWNPTPILPAVMGRPNALRSMLKHLVDNAVDAVNEPGASDREFSIVTHATKDGQVQVIITDTGPGMADAIRTKAFEPFFVGWQKKRRSRSGMGLSIVQEVLNDHGGSLDVFNEFSGGCRITVTLPVDHDGGWGHHE